jgi:hypothetical protein
MPSSSFTSNNEIDASGVNSFHLNSDVDKSVNSQHHTLGVSPTQASPGDHVHDGRTSKRISFSDIEGGLWNIDGGIPSTIYTPIPAWDGGGV